MCTDMLHQLVHPQDSIPLHMQKFSGSTCADREKIFARQIFGKGHFLRGKDYIFCQYASKQQACVAFVYLQEYPTHKYNVKFYYPEHIRPRVCTML